METSTITKVRGGTIAIPREIQKSWAGADIYLRFSDNSVIIKKISAPKKLFEKKTVAALKELGKKISQKDIQDAVKWARKKPLKKK